MNDVLTEKILESDHAADFLQAVLDRQRWENEQLKVTIQRGMIENEVLKIQNAAALQAAQPQETAPEEASADVPELDPDDNEIVAE